MNTLDFSVVQEVQEQIFSVDDQFVDEICKELEGQIERARVYAVAQEVESEFRDATVTTFIRIFIRRLTLERLMVEMNGED
jgi:hypothetical protein